MLNRLSFLICIGAAIVLLTLTTGCCSINTKVSIRPNFSDYERTAIFWRSRDEKVYETLFLTFWLDNFPEQTIVERKEISKVIREQDLLKRRLNDKTRAKIRKILGVDALILAEFNYKRRRRRSPIETEMTNFSIKILDTETGEIAASAMSSGCSRCNDSIIIETIKKIKMNIRNDAYRTPSP